MPNKKRVTFGSNQYDMLEILMPDELIEKIFDETTAIYYESEEEKEYKGRKEEYNRKILGKIKKLVFRKKKGILPLFTSKQQKIFKLMFIDGLTLTEIARKLDQPISTINEVKKTLLRNIKKYFKYEFNYNEENPYNI